MPIENVVEKPVEVIKEVEKIVEKEVIVVQKDEENEKKLQQEII